MGSLLGAPAIRKQAEDKLGELSAALEKAISAGPGRGKKRLPIGGKPLSKVAALNRLEAA
jgi:hypothetical protein